MTEEDEEHYRYNNICQFCEKQISSDKVRRHCHLTGKYRGQANDECKINVTQKQTNFILFVFHKLSNYDCHLISKKLAHKKKDSVKFDIILKTNEEYKNNIWLYKAY